MPNDMVCHCAEGELRIKQGANPEFVAKKGDVWSCNKGITEDTENIGSGVSIMRIIDFDLAPSAPGAAERHPAKPRPL